MNVSRIKERIVETPKAWHKDVAESDNTAGNGGHLKEEHKRLFSLSPIGILFIDMKGIVRFCNPAAYEKAGYSDKDFIGRHFSDLAEMTNISKRDLTSYYKMFNSLINGESFQPLDFEYKCKDGTTGYTEIHMSLLKEEDSIVGIIIYMMDITERKRVEEALRESEEKSSKAFRSSPNTVAITTLKEGRIIEINDTYTRITGHSREDVIGHSTSEFNTWVNPEERKRVLQTLKKKGSVRDEEVHLRLRSGEERVTLFSAEPITIDGEPCMISVAADITERKRVEDAIRESEEFSTSVLENAPNPITVINPDTSIRYVNPAFEKLTGFSLAEVAGMKAPFPWWPEDRRPTRLKGLKAFMAGGDKITQQIIETKSGERFHIELNMVRVMHNGEFKYYLAHWKDITKRKQAEEALAKEAVRRRILMEQSRDGIVILDQNGRVYEANRRFADMLGYTPEEVLQLHVWDWEFLYPPEKVAEMIRSVDDAGDHFETQHRRKDGSVYDVEISTNGATFAGQKLIFCVCRDITERKAAEQALQEAEDKFSKAFHSSPDSISITTIREGKIIDVNNAFTSVTGYTPEEVIGHNSTELGIWAKDVDRIRMLRKLKKHGRVNSEEYDFRVKSGEIRTGLFSAEPINIGGEPCVIAVITDITKRKRAEEALRESQEFSDCLLENAPNQVVVINPDTSVRYVNQAFIDANGWTFDEAVGQSIPYPWWPEEGREEMLEGFMRAMEQGSGQGEVIARKKSGEHYWISMNWTTVKHDGEPQFMLVNSTDITERKEAEEKLQESEEKFRSLAERSPNMIFINRNGRLVYVNDKCVEVMGYEREEFYAPDFDFLCLIAPESVDSCTANFVKQLQGEELTPYEYTIITKNGSRIEALVTTAIIKYEGENAIFGAVTDITERKKAEQALVEAEEKYRDLLDNTNELIQSVTPDGQFRYVNNGWKRVLGYSEEDIADLTVYDIIHPDYLQSYKSLFENITPGEDIGQVNMALVSKNGSKIIVEGNITCKFENNKLVYTRGIYRDITKNRYLEEQMFRLSSAVSMSTDCIVITDFDAKIIDINQRTLEIYGANSKEELVGKHFLELIVPAERVMVNMDVKEIMEKGSLECREYNMVSKHGQEFPVQMSTSLVRNAEGKPMGMVRVGRELGKQN